MFFILKDKKTIIAADNAFMEKTGVESIYLLAELFRVGEFPLSEADQTCQIDGHNETFTKTPVETLSGQAFLYDFSQESAAVDEAVSEQETLDILETVPEEMETSPFAEKDALADDHEALALLEEESQPLTPAPEALGTTPEKEKSSVDEDVPEATENSERFEIAPETSSPTSETKPREAEEASEQTDISFTEASLGAATAAGAAILLSDKEEKPAEEKTPSKEEDALLDLIEPDEVKPQEPLAEIGTTSAPESKSASSEELKPKEEEIFELIDLEDVKNPKESSDITPESTSETDRTLLDEPEVKEEEAPLTLSEPTSDHEAITPVEQASTRTPFADYQHNAQLIGISFEEYAGFLSQFVDESLEHEADLTGNDLRLFRENITSLKDASQLLHLPRLTEKLRETESATSDEKSALLDAFFAMIRHIQTDLKQRSEDTSEPQIHPATPETHPVEEERAATEPEESLPVSAPPVADTESILDHATPLPFDFSAHVAADELGLPEPLVEEFVADFVKQAKEHIPLFEEAQKNEDLDTIQKTAHLLKGAASNLRIDPLAETLETLQHNEDFAKVPNLFQRFIGQLKALDNFIHAPGM